MRKTKKLTLSALLSGLGTVLLLLGAFIEMLDLAMGAVASVIMIFVYIEIGSPYTWLVWLVTSLCAFLLGTANPMAAVWYFLLFGVYPILKAYIERTPRIIWLPIKLVYANAAFAAAAGIFWLIFRISPFALEKEWMIGAIWILGCFAFWIYDRFLSAMARVYLLKYKKRFSKLLK